MSVLCCKLSLQIKGRTSEEQLCQFNVPFYCSTLILLSLTAKAGAFKMLPLNLLIQSDDLSTAMSCQSEHSLPASNLECVTRVIKLS